MKNIEVVLKRFEHPDEVRTFPKGKFEIIHVDGMTIGRATYEPGWRYSEHVGNGALCDLEHVGIVLSGCATAAVEGKDVIKMRAGDVFCIAPGPPGHDSWVVGDEPYVSLHLTGARAYGNT